MSRPDLLDLRALAAGWRIRRDAEGLPVIPGRGGSIAAHTGEALAVHVSRPRLLRTLLRSLPAGWHRHQVGDDEGIFLAPAGDLARAASVILAYRSRQLSTEQRARLADRLRRPAPAL